MLVVLEKRLTSVRLVYVTDKASELYDAMVQLHGAQKQSVNKGKPIEQVGLRQQQRYHKEIRYSSLYNGVVVLSFTSTKI